MEAMLEHFKAGAERLRPAKRGRKCLLELKVHGARYANERQAGGFAWEETANELDVALLTIRRWCEERPEATGNLRARQNRRSPSTRNQHREHLARCESRSLSLNPSSHSRRHLRNWFDAKSRGARLWRSGRHA